MNDIVLIKTNWNELEKLYTEYFIELGYQNDGFYNSMMFEGEPYLITYNDQEAGFFSLGNSWTTGKMLRGFYIIPSKRFASIEIFGKVVEYYEIEAALVASNDTLFVGLAFETMNAHKTSFDMLAYNLIYGEPQREAEFGLECMKEVDPEEYESMNLITEKLWDGCYGDESYKFYKLVYEDKILGYGGIGRLKNNKRNVDVGNFTLAQHRRKGVGRSIIINLSKIAIWQGFIPVAGCGYGNKESVATLISSGYTPENRIFYIRLR